MSSESESESDSEVDDDDDDTPSELESWKAVHRTLIDAVKAARAAVDAQKAQRRFWLEEICSNLNDQGKLTAASVWKRPDVVTKRGPGAKKHSTVAVGAASLSIPEAAAAPDSMHSKVKPSTAGTKRKKKESVDSSTAEQPVKPAKKPRKKAAVKAEADSGEPDVEGAESASTPTKKPKIKISRRIKIPSQKQQHTAPGSPEEESDEQPHHNRHMAQQQSQDYIHSAAQSMYPPTEYGQQQGGQAPWSPQGAQANLQMMSAVAFGTNPPDYPASHGVPALMQPHLQQQYNSFYQQGAPPPAGYHPHAPPHHAAPQPHGALRTYSSIHDINSDEDSDADKF